MKELRAFKQLYQDLIDRYELLKTKDESFDEEYLHEFSGLQMLIKSYEKVEEFQPIANDMNKDKIDLGLDKLVKMEADLIKLERGII